MSWSFDGIYRLADETVTGDANSKYDGSVSYTGLDPVGNRTSASSTISGLTPVSGSYNLDDELTSSEGYDANGDVTSSGANHFNYDSQNELISMNGSAVQILYDGDGNRVAKSVTASGVTTITRYLVDDQNPTGLPQVMDELNGSGAVTRTYAYGLQRIDEDQIVNSAWTPSFYNYDGTDSVRQLTNASGTVTDTYEYDGFGNEISSTGTTPNNYLYRAEQWDSDLGLYYLRARYYNPLSGRFFSADPLTSEGQRRYEYADADPVDEADPTGQAAFEEFLLLNFRGSFQVPFPTPTFCFAAGSNPMSAFLPGCGGSFGGGTGAGGGTGSNGSGPGGPPPDHWTVKVDWRPLYAESDPRDSSEPGTHYGLLGHWRHTYIEIDPPGGPGNEETWGVLGINPEDPTQEGKKQEVAKNDYRDPLNGGGTGGYKPVICSDQEAKFLEQKLNATVYPGSECPSCGDEYKNLFNRHHSPTWKFFFNSNAYSYNMIDNFIGDPPPIDRAPGYAYSRMYADYPD